MRPHLPISKESLSKEAARKCPDCPFCGCKRRVRRCRRSWRARLPWSCRNSERRSRLSLAKIQNGYKKGPFASVVDFVTATAPNFNKTLQRRTTVESFKRARPATGKTWKGGPPYNAVRLFWPRCLITHPE